MEHLRRLKKVINWLIFKEIAENERALAETMGYTKSSFSQIVTGKVPLSEKFMKRICSLDENINFVWLQSGEGEMFLSNNLNSEDGGVAVPKDAWEIIKQQAESLSVPTRFNHGGNALISGREKLTPNLQPQPLNQMNYADRRQPKGSTPFF
jgi:hypothetical protein